MRLAAKILLGVVVLLLAGYAMLYRSDIPYTELERKYANAESRFIDLPGGFHAHFRDQGNRNGPALLLIHGFGVSLDTWDAWVKRLGTKYRMVSVDLPGHGLTRAASFEPSADNYADFVASFARAIHLARATVVGNSMGGGVAWLLALRHPELVERLVLVDASGFESTRAGSSGPPVFLKVLGNPFIAVVARNLDKTSVFRRMVPSAYFNPALATDAMVTRYAELSRAPGHREILDDTLVDTLRGDPDAIASDAKLAKVGVPTLILWGDRDKLVDPGDARKFAHAIPNAKLIFYRNVGHVPMEEAAAQSAADLDAWMTKAR